MEKITTIGVDLAKSIFQVHAIDAAGGIVLQKALRPLADQLGPIDIQLTCLNREIQKWHQANAVSQRFASIPGVGPITASAIAASVTEPSMFASAREFSAYLGLAPRQNSRAGKTKLGRVSKMGDRYIRTLLVNGAVSLLSPKRKHSCVLDVWARHLIEKGKATKLVAIALANKIARIAWALLTRDETFREPVPRPERRAANQLARTMK